MFKSRFVKELARERIDLKKCARELLGVECSLSLREAQTYFWRALPYFETEHINILLDLCDIIGLYATAREYYTPSTWRTIYVQIWKHPEFVKPQLQDFLFKTLPSWRDRLRISSEFKKQAVRLALSDAGSISFSISENHSFRPILKFIPVNKKLTKSWAELIGDTLGITAPISNGVIQYQTIRVFEAFENIGGFLRGFYTTKGNFEGFEKEYLLRKFLQFHKKKPKDWYYVQTPDGIRDVFLEFIKRGGKRYCIEIERIQR